MSLLDDKGKLNATRYPNLAALAADGVWFRNATAVSDYTRWALPSIVTGRYPAARSTPTPRDHPNTVFSLVGRSHRLEVSEAVTPLCPRQLCRETGHAAVRSRVRDGRRHRRRCRPRVSAAVSTRGLAGPDAELGGVRGSRRRCDEDRTDDLRARRSRHDRRTRHPGHAELAAAMAAPRSAIMWDRPRRSSTGSRETMFNRRCTSCTRSPRTGRRAGCRPGSASATLRGIPGLTDGKWTDQEWLVAQHHHADIMQAGLADTLIGRLRDRLSSAGLYDDALVIVTADHGVSLRPGDRARSFSGDNAAEILSVPLIVKPPEATAGVTTRNHRRCERRDDRRVADRRARAGHRRAVAGGRPFAHRRRSAAAREEVLLQRRDDDRDVQAGRAVGESRSGRAASGRHLRPRQMAGVHRAGISRSRRARRRVVRRHHVDRRRARGCRRQGNVEERQSEGA